MPGVHLAVAQVGEQRLAAGGPVGGQHHSCPGADSEYSVGFHAVKEANVRPVEDDQMGCFSHLRRQGREMPVQHLTTVSRVGRSCRPAAAWPSRYFRWLSWTAKPLLHSVPSSRWALEGEMLRPGPSRSPRGRAGPRGGSER